VHRGDTEIGENDVNAGEFCLGKDFWQAGEVRVVSGEKIWTESECAKTSFGFGEFDRIGVEAEQTSVGLKSRQNFLRVATVAKRAVHGDFARLRREHVENFLDHDRAVGAGGGFAGSEDFSNGLGVALGMVLFVFFFEAARISAGVTRAAAMRW